MFILGHLGIGSKIVSPWTKGLPKAPVFIGCLLPDLIDKPLYYGLAAITGLGGADLGIIDGTRTFGHTAIFLIVVAVFAWYRRSLWLSALALGIASHLMLDNLSDALRQDELRSAMVALAWPLAGVKFVAIPYKGLGEHLSNVWNRVTIGAEIIGFGILAWDGWKVANERQIIRTIRTHGIRSALTQNFRGHKRKGHHLRRVK
jgi:hypothetical protein